MISKYTHFFPNSKSLQKMHLIKKDENEKLSFLQVNQK